MQAVNKIHITNSTKLSLNDRFSNLHSTPQPAPITKRRNAYQGIPATVEKASIRNRNLLAQLDQKHKVRAAMKIKRKSMRPNVRVATATQRGLIAARSQRGLLAPRSQRGSIGRGRPATAAAVLKRNNLANARSAAAAARLRRENNIAILLAQSERQSRGASISRRRRSVSTSRGGLAGRLGVNAVPQQQQAFPRRRLNRNNFSDQSAVRANSRSRSMTRNSSQHQSRAGSRTREPSVQRSRGRSASRSRGRAPSVAKANIVQRRASVSGRPGRPNNSSAKSRGGVAVTPVRSRLGGNRKRIAGGQAGAQRTVPGVANGRVQKRRASIARRAPTAAQSRLLGNNRSRANSTPRQAPPQARGRSQSRGRQPAAANRQGKPNNRNVPQSNRSRSAAKVVPRAKAGARAPSRGRNASKTQQGGKPKAAVQTPKTREQLDKELDQYMVNRSEM